MKQALHQRKQGELSSNFSFRMMEQVRREAVRQQKRRDRVMLYSIVAASLALIALVVYLLFFVLDLQMSEWFPKMEWKSASTSSMLFFYMYIAVLALALLGFDHWMRHRKLNKH